MPITSRKKFGWIVWETFMAMLIAKVVSASSRNPRWICASSRPPAPIAGAADEAAVAGSSPATAEEDGVDDGAATRLTSDKPRRLTGDEAFRFSADRAHPCVCYREPTRSDALLTPAFNLCRQPERRALSLRAT